jgi:DNA mismatch repair protein PMS2
VVVADLKIPTDSYDVNVSPDKRTIFIHEESKIIDCITEQLKEQLEPSRSTFQVNALMMVKSVEVDDHQGPESKSTPSSSKSALSSSSMQNIEDRSSSSVKKIGDSPLSKVRTIANLGSFAMSNSNSYSAKTSSTAKRSYPTTTTSTLLKYMSKKPKTEATLSFKRSEVEDMEVDELREDDEIKPKEQDDDAMEVEVLEKKDLAASNDSVNQVEVLEKEDVTESADSTHQVENEDSSELGTIDSREYVEMVTGIKSYSGLCKTVGRTLILSPIDFTHLKQAEAISSTKSPVPTAAQTILKNASVKNTDDNEKATKALSRVISKPDFARMQVLGQFNLGFMITSLDDQDLYIVDQHASDEKYNFETLQQTTQIKGQRLLRYCIQHSHRKYANHRSYY